MNANPLRDMIMEEIVKPEIAAANKTFIGTIASYDATTSTAQVTVGKPNTLQTYNNVPVPTGLKAVYGDDIGIGTMVVLSFLQGDMSYPYIATIVNDEAIDLNTGKTYGSYSSESAYMAKVSLMESQMNLGDTPTTTAPTGTPYDKVLAQKEKILSRM
jgi:hypothetical protein